MKLLEMFADVLVREYDAEMGAGYVNVRNGEALGQHEADLWPARIIYWLQWTDSKRPTGWIDWRMQFDIE